MIGIVLADNLFMMFIFWELVAIFSSWLLINHWHERPAPPEAAKKAFITNRVGDFGFLLGILMCFWTRGTVQLSDLAVQASSGGAILQPGDSAVLLFCGAVGKSAQLPLQVWLPDAMEGSDARLGLPDPCRHHGGGRHLHALPHPVGDGAGGS